MTLVIIHLYFDKGLTTMMITRDLADFLEFVICKKNLWTYVLYNYDNLPYDSNDIT